MRVPGSYPLRGLSVSPMPRWSTAMTVKSRASAGITKRRTSSPASRAPAAVPDQHHPSPRAGAVRRPGRSGSLEPGREPRSLGRRKRPCRARRGDGSSRAHPPTSHHQARSSRRATCKCASRHPRGISREAEREDGPPCGTTEDVFMRPPLASLPVELCRRVSSMQPRFAPVHAPGLPRTPGRELDLPAPLSRWQSGRRSPARTVSAFVASGWSPEPVCFASGHTRRRRESTLRRLRRV